MYMKKIILTIIITLVSVGGLLYLLTRTQPTETPGNVVTMEDGVQVVTIKAKGGYQPRTVVAQAGIPTILRFTTKGTFDCSSSIRIPSLDIFSNLPQTGVTDIDVGTQTGTLKGSCGMGMYPFEVTFQG
jgi:plastocyanin domain-containing protein